MNKQTRNKTNKQTHTQNNSKFRNSRISVSVVLVLLLQHPVLVLVFKWKLCLSLARWFWCLASFSSVFQWQLLSQLLPQWGVACPQIPEISPLANQPSCLSVKCLSSRFGAGAWQCRSPLVFSVWHSMEKLCMGLGVRVSKILLLLVLYFL
jgi:hypothetical protein